MHGQDEGERLGPIFSQGKSSPVLLTDTGESDIIFLLSSLLFLPPSLPLGFQLRRTSQLVRGRQ